MKRISALGHPDHSRIKKKESSRKTTDRWMFSRKNISVEKMKIMPSCFAMNVTQFLEAFTTESTKQWYKSSGRDFETAWENAV